MAWGAKVDAPQISFTTRSRTQRVGPRLSDAYAMGFMPNKAQACGAVHHRASGNERSPRGRRRYLSRAQHCGGGA